MKLFHFSLIVILCGLVGCGGSDANPTAYDIEQDARLNDQELVMGDISDQQDANTEAIQGNAAAAIEAARNRLNNRPRVTPPKPKDSLVESKVEPGASIANRGDVIVQNIIDVKPLIDAVDGLRATIAETKRDDEDEKVEIITPVIIPAPRYSEATAIEFFKEYCRGLMNGNPHWRPHRLSRDAASWVNKLPPGIWTCGPYEFEYREVPQANGGIYTIFYYDIVKRRT